MKKSIQSITFLFLFVSLLFTSCGPSKKLLVSQAKFDKLQKENANTVSRLNDCNNQVASLNKEKDALKNENASTQNDLKILNNQS